MGHRITSHVHINLLSHVSIKLYDLLMISIQSYSFSWPMPKKWILLTFQPGISGNTPDQGRPGHPNPVPFSAPSTASVRRIRHRHYLGVRKKSERTTELQKIIWSWFNMVQYGSIVLHIQNGSPVSEKKMLIRLWHSNKRKQMGHSWQTCQWKLLSR